MILVDSSVWIDHLRRSNVTLAGLLESFRVCCHPFVRGELACGNLANRAGVLGQLALLPQAVKASDDEVLCFIENNGLMGRGIGLVDAHLLAAAALSPDVRMWTLDRRLARVAEALGLAYRPARISRR
jgi:predicted nucleic acid-binding protein